MTFTDAPIEEVVADIEKDLAALDRRVDNIEERAADLGALNDLHDRVDALERDDIANALERTSNSVGFSNDLIDQKIVAALDTLRHYLTHP